MQIPRAERSADFDLNQCFLSSCFVHSGPYQRDIVCPAKGPIMRSNLPITNKEVQLAAGEAIVSKTDLKGNLVYVNPTFSRISGLQEYEALGQPQNIVRHPDMPPEAFADMWSTIQGG